MKILFICTHNRCRSILAEAVFNHYSNGKVIAKSAGSQPEGEVHPLSLEALSTKGFSIDGLKSQSWDDHEDWHPDIVITVCDSAAGEVCPVWFGNSIKIHWGLKDPSAGASSKEKPLPSFFELIDLLSERAKKVNTENVKNMIKEELKNFLSELGA